MNDSLENICSLSNSDVTAQHVSHEMRHMLGDMMEYGMMVSLHECNAFDGIFSFLLLPVLHAFLLTLVHIFQIEDIF
jgi:hypothetical protein